MRPQKLGAYPTRAVCQTERVGKEENSTGDLDEDAEELQRTNWNFSTDPQVENGND